MNSELPIGPRVTSRPSTPPWASITRPAVLVVDDNPIQRKLTTLRLIDEGLNVHSAEGAIEALSIARRVRPDAILSDVVMGDVDGFNFCRMVRRDPAVAHIPVILVSAHFHEHCDQQLATAVGADELVGRTPDMLQELDALRRAVRSLGAPNKGSVSGPALSAMYMRSVAGQLSRLAHGSQTAEIKYRTFFEHATDALSMIDADGVLLEVNRRWEQILQLPRERIVGHHIREFAAPGHVEANLATYQSVLIGHARNTQLITVAGADGSVVAMEMTSTRVEVDGSNVVFAIGRDVTQTLEAQRQLAESEQKYQSLVENIPVAVWSTTADGTPTFVSPNIVKLCGYTAEQMIALHRDNDYCGVHQADLTRLDAAFRALLKDGTPMDVVYRCQHADGSWKWLHARGTPRRDEQGRIACTHGTLSDVTERRLLEDQLHRSQKLEAIGQLTGGVAHDFNNLLAVILGNVGFLLEELQDGDARRSDALDIRDAAERAAVLTRQLLAFSRQQPIAPVVFDLNTVVENLQKMLRRVTSEDIELVVQGGAQASRVHADPGQIEQVIMNLTVNARDAMPSGGTLHISTEDVDLGDDTAPQLGARRTASRGKYVCVSVRDTGVGMDEQVRQHIFEPFFTTKGPGKGTGLGLATCFGIVEHSGGFIDVESAPGAGTTIRVFLPAVQDEQSASSSDARAPAAARGDETILVIEDDDQVRRTVVRLLRARGYHVLAASDGTGALDLAAMPGTEVDLVLSDVVLAGADGFYVADRVREVAPTSRVLFMSGHVDHATLDGRELESSSTFIQKPFSPDDLARKVRAVLDASG